MRPNMSEFSKNKSKALDRAGHKCEDCSSTGRLDAHHIDLSRDNHSVENLKILCHLCHIKNYHPRKYPVVVTDDVVSHHCHKCNHKWNPRTDRKPLCCPSCKSYNWFNDLKEVSSEDILPNQQAANQR